MRNVVILGTGGTIAGVAAPGSFGYTAGRIDIDEVINAVPGIETLAHIRGEQVSNVASQDMSFAIMMELSRRINELLASKDIVGIVVTHGTDTMEETAYFLNLTIKSKKPVVITGAMRPATAISADGPLNLYNAVAVAADPEAAGRGVLVVMNDRIHGAHSLTKTNTTSVETFLSPINGPVGTVIYGLANYFRYPFRKHTFVSEFGVKESMSLPRVDIFHACADMSDDLIDCSVEKGARGIVIAGHGNGNINRYCLGAARRAVARGVVVVRSSSVSSGSVGRNIEVDDDSDHFIVADDLNPVKSRILLMLALTRERTISELQDLFYSY